MDEEKKISKRVKPFREAIYIAIVYFIMSIIWILFSDYLLLELANDNPVLFGELQTFKGIAFVCVSTVVLFSVIYHRVKNQLRMTDELDKQKKLTQAKIDYIGLHDTLTGLPKRLLLEKRFLNLIEDSHLDKSVALVHLEIDNFVQMNEVIGNVAGDEYILYISKILEGIVEGNDLLARLSQDAFGILLTDVKSKLEIENKLKTILKELEKSWQYEDREFSTTATAGISIYPDDCLEFYCLLRYSNIALRYAKIVNKGSYEFYSKDTEDRIVNNLEIIDNMKKALINEEFYLNYQIVLGLQNQTLEWVETLIRWNHPEKGNIPPLDFIPIAEQSNLIIEITEYVLNKALQQKKEWNEQGYSIGKMSVNISANSMNTIGFCCYIEEKLIQYGIKGEELILELTESIFVEDVKEMDINIKHLRGLGVQIALDDFGTGYSTLARLKDLSIDYLKLDRTFIMNMTKDSNDASLVKSVIEVAKLLNIEVLAEGIETVHSMELLREMGCSLGQGFLIHKPSETLPKDFMFKICN